jgi:hypothetical protein
MDLALCWNGVRALSNIAEVYEALKKKKLQLKNRAAVRESKSKFRLVHPRSVV